MLSMVKRALRGIFASLNSRNSQGSRAASALNKSTVPSHSFRKPTLAYRASETTPALVDIDDGEIVQVVYEGAPVWIMFRCPCGQGHVISLPAAEGRQPQWRLSVREGRASLSPSVYQRELCFSHFWITDGEIRWCRNSGTPPWIAEPRYYNPPVSDQ